MSPYCWSFTLRDIAITKENNEKKANSKKRNVNKRRETSLNNEADDYYQDMPKQSKMSDGLSPSKGSLLNDKMGQNPGLLSGGNLNQIRNNQNKLEWIYI